MTKQPSLTSLLDLGLICGPLGDSILDEKISSSTSSPQSPPSHLQDNLNDTKIKKIEQRSSNDEKPTNPNNKEEIKPEIKMKIDNISTNVEAAKPDEDDDDDNEAARDEQLASDESASASSPTTTTNRTTTTLKAPKLSRNEASISSLSSFFMNNQLKTLNFFYYPSLITKSKWYHASNDATASTGNQFKQIDEKLDQMQLDENHGGKVQKKIINITL